MSLCLPGTGSTGNGPWSASSERDSGRIVSTGVEVERIRKTPKQREEFPHHDRRRYANGCKSTWSCGRSRSGSPHCEAWNSSMGWRALDVDRSGARRSGTPGARRSDPDLRICAASSAYFLVRMLLTWAGLQRSGQWRRRFVIAVRTAKGSRATSTPASHWVIVGSRSSTSRRPVISRCCRTAIAWR